MVLTLALRAVPVADHRPSVRRLDIPGAILTTAAAILIVTGFTFAAEKGWAAPATLIASATGIVAAVVLLIVGGRTRDPLLDIRRFTNGHLATGTGSAFLFLVGFGATAYLLTLYFQQIRGLSLLVTGLAFVIPCVGVLIEPTSADVSPPAPVCAPRTPHRHRRRLRQGRTLRAADAQPGTGRPHHHR